MSYGPFSIIRSSTDKREVTITNENMTLVFNSNYTFQVLKLLKEHVNTL